MYKRNIKKTTNNRRTQSNFLYVLFIPFIMYIYHFMYGIGVQNQNNIQSVNVPNKIHNDSIFDSLEPSESLLTSPFPESSINISSSTSSK